MIGKSVAFVAMHMILHMCNDPTYAVEEIKIEISYLRINLQSTNTILKLDKKTPKYLKTL